MKYPNGKNGQTARKTKVADKQLVGKKSKAAGQLFENYIDAACVFYSDNKGIALIEKTPEPMRPTSGKGNDGSFTAKFAKKAQPDYKGTLKGGQAIVFEAKHTDSDKISKSRITNWQEDNLERHHRLGARCGVLISIQMQDFYFVPWNVWRSMQTIYGRVSMTREELEDFRVPFLGGVIRFLKGMEGVLEFENNINH